MSKAKIAVAHLSLRRIPLLKTHIRQLSNCKYKDFHLYVLAESLPHEYRTLVLDNLPNATVIDDFVPSDLNYISKVEKVISLDHPLSIKFDEDCVLTSEGWDRFFELVESMNPDDLFCTGAISNGIPSCDHYVRNFIKPDEQHIINNMFSMTRFGYAGSVDYSPLNNSQVFGEWNPSRFYDAVRTIRHHYLGVHPVRVNFIAARILNNMILNNLPSSMTPIKSKVIRDNQYPYFCNSFFGIRTSDWRTIVSSKHLFVDPYEEVPLNKYWKETSRKMVMDTGIPILHTMYNWSQNWDYENELIEKINHIYA